MAEEREFENVKTSNFDSKKNPNNKNKN